MAKLNIEEILDRLWRGETLRIDDQEVAYIRFVDGGDMPSYIAMRRILDAEERKAIAEGKEPQYTEWQRYQSLAEALLSLMDWEWQR